MIKYFFNLSFIYFHSTC